MYLCFVRLSTRGIVQFCVASCFHHCPRSFWTELQHQLWVLCAAESGHWVHLTSDLPTASGGEAFLLKRVDHLAGPTWSSQSHIPRDAFPTMDQTHHSVLSWHKSREVGDHMSGVLPSTHGGPDLHHMPQLGHSPQVRGKMKRAWIWEKGLVSLIRQRNIWFWFLKCSHCFLTVTCNVIVQVTLNDNRGMITVSIF